jgi:hypothetical protein
MNESESQVICPASVEPTLKGFVSFSRSVTPCRGQVRFSTASVQYYNLYIVQTWIIPEDR